MIAVAKLDTFEINKINSRIRKHWMENYSEDENSSFHCWPMQYPSLNKNCFLFVGLNPSLKVKDKENGEFVLKSKKSLSDGKINAEIIRKDEKYRGGADRDKERGYPLCQVVFQEINEGHKSFESWDYIDLFSNRILEAAGLRKELEIVGRQKKVSWPEGGSAAEQLEIFRELLDSLKPKVVLVANALASNILIKEMDLKDAERGYSSLPKKIPIFFSSSVSGGHLDVFSRRRLVDQIRDRLARE